MEKRVILAFVMSFIVLYAFRALYVPPPQPEEQKQSAQVPNSPTSPNPTLAEKTPGAAAEEVSTSPVTDVHADKTEEVTIDTPLYTAKLSNQGGVLTSFRLKAYTDDKGQPLQLINQYAGSRVGWPLTLQTDDAALTDGLNKALYAVTRDGDRVV